MSEGGGGGVYNYMYISCGPASRNVFLACTTLILQLYFTWYTHLTKLSPHPQPRSRHSSLPSIRIPGGDLHPTAPARISPSQRPVFVPAGGMLGCPRPRKSPPPLSKRDTTLRLSQHERSQGTRLAITLRMRSRCLAVAWERVS